MLSSTPLKKSKNRSNLGADKENIDPCIAVHSRLSLSSIWDDGDAPVIDGFCGKGILKTPSPATNDRLRHVKFSDGNIHTRFYHRQNLIIKGTLRPVPGGKRDQQQEQERSISTRNDRPWTVLSQPLTINISFLPAGQHHVEIAKKKPKGSVKSAPKSKEQQPKHEENTASPYHMKLRSKSIKSENQIEMILDSREKAKGQTEYLTKWKGKGVSESTWMPANFFESHAEFVLNYEGSSSTGISVFDAVHIGLDDLPTSFKRKSSKPKPKSRKSIESKKGKPTAAKGKKRNLEDEDRSSQSKTPPKKKQDVEDRRVTRSMTKNLNKG